MDNMNDDAMARDGLEPIAIIGMAARYPGQASTVTGLWDMMKNARTAHSEVPADRWNVDSWYHPNSDRKGTTNTRVGCFLSEDVGVFDAPFFSMTAQEASGMDPMQRLMLEVAYESLENAGVPITRISGTMTSVYCGCFTGDYGDLANADIYDAAPYQATGKGKAMLANRISWFFDARGASFTVDTACSSSLYALHLACQSLRLKESKMAIVGGTNLLLTPDMMHSLTAQRFLSPDGISHAFDSRANGYGRGEGIGAIIIKPLRTALADGDTIRAVIRGSGLNQDGHTPGITMPSVYAQADLIRQTYAAAGLPLHETGFFQAHGTGTALGDPIELAAIGATFGKARSSGQAPLYVSSVKTNIGHTEGASGLAGVIAAVLSLEHGYVPPNAGWETLNPKLRLQDWGVALAPETIPWPSQGLRRASVNSFGYGGANAHVILDDAHSYLSSRGLAGNHQTYQNLDVQDIDSGINSDTSSQASHDDGPERQYLFVFSSFDQSGLQRLCNAYEDYVNTQLRATDKACKSANVVIEDESRLLIDIAHTLSERRTLFSYRSFVTADSLESLQENLQQGLPKLGRAAKSDSLIWVFTGQGAQWPTMGLQLLSHRVFLESVRKTQRVLEVLGCSWDLLDELARPDSKRLDSPLFSQPICTAVQLALVDTLRYWGVMPHAVIGHSSGEIAAAYAAKAICHEDAVKIAYQRGIHSADVRNRQHGLSGSMLAVGVGADVAQGYVDDITEGSACIACYNSPSSVTLSGDLTAIVQLEERIQKDGIFARQVRVQTAYHSHHMQLVAADYERSLGDIRPADTCSSDKPVVMFSSVTGTVVDEPSELGAKYWVQNMVQPVKFAQAFKELLSHSPSRSARRKGKVHYSAVIEVGPHEALRGPIRQILTEFDAKLATSLTYVSTLRRGQDAEITAVGAAATLWSLGHHVDVSKINSTTAGAGAGSAAFLPKTRIDLPSYPWNHEHRFWHESLSSKARRFQKHPRTDLLGAEVNDQNPLAPRWRNILRIPENPWLQDHQIQGSILFPAAGMLVMALEAAKQLAYEYQTEPVGYELCAVKFERGLSIPSEDSSVETSLHMQPLYDGQVSTAAPSRFAFKLFSCTTAGTWSEHSSGFVRIIYDESQELSEWAQHKDTYSEIKSVATRTSTRAFYNGLDAVGMRYGPTFKNMTEAFTHTPSRSACGTITIPDTKAAMPSQFEFPHVIHPATLDAVFHLLFAGNTGGHPMKEASVPISLGRLYVSARIPSLAGHELQGYTQCRSKNQKETIGTVVMSSMPDFREPAIVIHDFVAKEISSSSRAVEQLSRMEESIAPKRSGHLRWAEDVDLWRGRKDSLQGNSSSGNVPLQTLEEQLLVWLDRLCHKEAELDVLVLNNGCTSRILLRILRRFAPMAGRRFCFRTCTIADKGSAAAQGPIKASTDTIQLLKQELEDNKLQCDGLDPDSGSPGSDLAPKTFDLIIGAIQMPAGSDPETYLQSLKPFISDRGRLILCGPAGDGSSNAAPISKALWHEVLGRVGLIAAPNHSLDSPEASLLISSAAPEDDNPLPSEIYLLQAPTLSPGAVALKQNIEGRLASLGAVTRAVSLPEAASLQGEWVISLIELEEPFVLGWTAESLEAFKSLVMSARYVLWITRGGQLLDSSNIDWSPTTGLLRTLRVEMAKLTIPHLDLSPGLDLSSELAVDVILDCFIASSPSKLYQTEMEFVEKHGDILIPRFASNESFDQEIDRYSAQLNKSYMGHLHLQHGRMLKLSVGSTGTFDDVRWTDDEEFDSNTMGSDDVEVEVQYVSLDHNDIDVVRGASLLTTPGRQASGMVTRVGANVKRIQPGQDVVILRSGAGRMHAIQSQDLVQQIPASLSLINAVSLPLAYVTAYYALVHISKPQAGDLVLVHEAGTAVGQAAVQIAQYLGCRVYATISSSSERKLLVELHGMTQERIFDAHSTDLAKNVMCATGSKGIDVVFQTRPEVVAAQAWLCVAQFGHFVEVGRGNQYSAYMNIAGSHHQTNVIFAVVDMESVQESRRQLVSAVLSDVFELLQNGSVGMICPPTVFPVSHINKALQKLSESKSSCNVVLDIKANEAVPIMFPRLTQLQLDPTAAYVLSGGLGGLGPSVAELMIQNGARHLIFISRSGAASEEAREVLRHLQSLDCATDAFACDIGDTAALQTVMQTCRERNYKVRGLVQCAMVLRDSTFENMTHQKWTESTQPKIRGTWNLHELLPKDMDFFIMLSSVSGIIGNPAQGNYTAGNTYQDGLALYRRRLGLPATALAVGAVMDVGAFADNSYFENFLEKFEHLASLQVKIEEVMVILATLMKGRTEDGVPTPPLLAMGFTEELKRTGNITSLWAQDRKFDHRIEIQSGVERESPDKIGAGHLLSQASSLQAAGQVVEHALKTNLANAMTASPEDVDSDRPLHFYGVDSLKAVEVRNWLFRELGCDVSVFDILSPMPLSELAVKIAGRSKYLNPELSARDADRVDG